MRIFLRTISFFALLLLLTAEDCANSGERSYSARDDIFQNIENEFTADKISSENLEAFEKRAIQKLNDVMDYVSIYADTAYSSEFRIQAGKMIDGAFLSKEDLGTFYERIGFQEDTVNQILIASDGYSGCLEIDSMKIIQQFNPVSSLEYHSELSYRFSNQNSVFTENLTIIAKKTPKQFGSNSLQVWELYFKL